MDVNRDWTAVRRLFVQHRARWDAFHAAHTATSQLTRALYRGNLILSHSARHATAHDYNMQTRLVLGALHQFARDVQVAIEQLTLCCKETAPAEDAEAELAAG